MKNYNVYVYHDTKPIGQVTARNTLEAYIKAHQAYPEEEERTLQVRQAWSEIVNHYTDDHGVQHERYIRASAYTGENHEGRVVYGVKVVLPDESNLDIRADYDDNGYLNVYVNGRNLYEK